ncbi:APC family permease [Microbacteriaceae bacterium 4G12]
MTALERAIASPPPVPGLGRRSPVEGLDRRSVGFVDVLAQSVSAMAPSAAATLIPALVAGVVGSPGGTVLALGTALLLSLLVAGSVNEFARRIAAAGSLYTYVVRSLGAGAGVATGTALLLGYGFISMFALTGAGHTAALLLARAAPAAGGSPLLPAAVIAVLAAVVFAVVAGGVRLSTRVTLVVESVSVVIILALVVALLVTVGPVGIGVLSLEGTSPAAFAVGAVLAVTAFVGFETPTSLGVEARRPYSAIPRAVRWTVLGAGGFYLLACYSQLVGFDALGLDITASDSPVDDLASANGVTGVGLMLDVGIAASCLACAIASMTALARVLFSMGREGVLPAAFGRTHPRFRTPLVAVAASVPVVAAVPVVTALAGVALWDAMRVLLVASAAGYITAYLLACVAVPVLLHRIGELTAAVGLRAVSAAVILGGALVAYLVLEVTSERWAGVLVFAAGMAAGGIAYAIALRRRPWLRATIGVYDEPVAADVLGAGSTPAAPGGE